MVPPEQLLEMLRPFHERRINTHVHCNGDLTIDLWIDVVEQLLLESAWLDHRYTVQHSQLTSAAQYRRMAKLGMCANIFSNHIWYWGDQHHDITVGPERARRMEACRTARRSRRAVLAPHRRKRHAAWPSPHDVVCRQPRHPVRSGARRA